METLPEGTRVGRVALDVADVDRVAAFYADVVGLQRLDGGAARGPGSGDAVALGVGDEALLVVRPAPDDGNRPRDAAGLFHVAVRVPSRAALAGALARLRDAGRLGGASDHLVSEALYASDPEGNGVEVYRDRPRAAWERSADGSPRIDTLPLDLADLESAGGGDDTAGGDGVPVGTDVGHVHLAVTDLEEARAFYVDGLGFDLVERVRGGLFVAAGGYHHHVGLNVWQGRSEPAEGRGLAWLELVVPTSEELSEVIARLDDAGYDVRETEDGARAVDPDGIEVRLVVEG
jgi:catechol 2,3-dioxygenase